MIELDKEAIAAIQKIIARGNDAEVRKRGDRVVVLEVRKTIKYSVDK